MKEMTVDEAQAAFGRLMGQHRGHALIAESEDWDSTISPALTALGLTIGGYFPPSKIPGIFNTLRCAFEAVYQMGYSRREKEEQRCLPVFMVAEEDSE